MRATGSLGGAGQCHVSALCGNRPYCHCCGFQGRPGGTAAVQPCCVRFVRRCWLRRPLGSQAAPWLPPTRLGPLAPAVQVATSEVVTGPIRLLFPRVPGSIGEAAGFPFSLLGESGQRRAGSQPLLKPVGAALLACLAPLAAFPQQTLPCRRFPGLCAVLSWNWVVWRAYWTAFAATPLCLVLQALVTWLSLGSWPALLCGEGGLRPLRISPCAGYRAALPEYARAADPLPQAACT